MQILKQLSAHVCLTLLSSRCNVDEPVLLSQGVGEAQLLERMRYLHSPQHAFVLEAFFRDQLLSCGLTLEDQAQECEDYFEVCTHLPLCMFH